jgi:hypothetical protein
MYTVNGDGEVVAACICPPATSTGTVTTTPTGTTSPTGENTSNSENGFTPEVAEQFETFMYIVTAMLLFGLILAVFIGIYKLIRIFI